MSLGCLQLLLKRERDGAPLGEPRAEPSHLFHREIGIILPNNQRQHIQKDVLPCELC